MAVGRFSTMGTGVYAPAEIHYLIRPGRGWNRRIILWHHGAGGETLAIVTGNAARLNSIALVRRLVSAGYSLMSCDFGGANTFGNDTAMSRITDAVTYAGTLGYDTDKVGLWGESMGHMNVYNWAHRNPTKVAAIIGMIPLCDAQAVYDGDIGGLASDMDAAYGGNWAGNASTRDPKQILGIVSGLNWRIYYASDDPLVPAADAVALAAALGKSSQAFNMGPGGHDDDPVATVDPASFVGFFEAGAW